VENQAKEKQIHKLTIEEEKEVLIWMDKQLKSSQLYIDDLYFQMTDNFTSLFDEKKKM
jgi:hypothetical protein